MDIVKNILANYEAYLAALNGLVLALIAVCLLIPGEQPEKALRGFADFLAKFSRKPVEPEQK